MNEAERLALEDLARIDQLADCFEAEWSRDAGEPLPDFLDRVRGELSAESRQRLLIELVKVDFQHRQAAGMNPAIDDYFCQFPQLKEAGEHELNQLVRDTGQFRQRNVDAGRTLAAGGETAVHSVVMGRYRLLQPIGTGGFGVVYKAHDVELDRLVAIKIPRVESRADDAVERIVREARAAATLNHPGIVRIHDISFATGVPCIVSELLEGRSLREELQSGRRFTARESAALVARVAEALHFAHRRGLVHRDIKPSNLFLRGGDDPVILDFGIARLDNHESLTAQGQLLGTPAYMPPEQATGQASTADARSDVYSLGMVLFELLAGELPFRGNPHFLLQQVVSESPGAPSCFRDSVPADLDTICLKALEKNPGQRYATAEALADDLRRFLDDQPIQARPVTRFGRLWRWCRRNPRTAVPGFVAAVSLVLATLGATISSVMIHRLSVHERDARIVAELESSRSHAESGVLRLQQGNGLGLLDLLRSVELSSASSVEQRSRYLLAESWLSEFEGQLKVLVNHDDTPWTAAFSPDGHTFLTFSRDGTVEHRFSRSGEPASAPRSTDSYFLVDQVRFSPDGSRMVTSHNAATAFLWRDRDGNLELDEFAHRGINRANGFDRTGRVWCSFQWTDDEGNTHIDICDADNGRTAGQTLVLPYRDAKMEFDTECKRLAVAAANPLDSDTDPLTITLVDVASGKFRQRSFDTAAGQPGNICFSPDGEMLAIAWQDHTVRLYDLELQPAAVIQHSEDVKDLAFSPDGTLLASASFDSTAKIRQLNQPDGSEIVLRHDGPVLTLDFSADGSLLATGGFDSRVRVWQSANGNQVGNPFVHQDIVRLVRFEPRGHLLLSLSADRTTRIWNPLAGQAPLHQLAHSGRVWSLDYSPDGTRLMTTSQDGMIHRWNVVDGSPATEPVSVAMPSSDLVAARFNPARPNEILAVNLRQIRFLNDAGQPDERYEFRPEAAFRSISFSCDGRFAVVGTDGPEAWLLELDQAGVRGHVLPHPAGVTDVAFHPDGQWFATSCQDGEVRLWDIALLQPPAAPLRHESPVEVIAFSSDGQWLATAARDLVIRIWSGDNWSEVSLSIPQSTSVQALAFSPDNRLLASAAADGRVQLWDTVTGLPAGMPFRHGTFATSVAFSPDGRQLAIGSFDKTASLWSVPGENVGEPASALRQRIWLALGARENGDTIEPLREAEFRTIRAQQFVQPLAD